VYLIINFKQNLAIRGWPSQRTRWRAVFELWSSPCIWESFTTILHLIVRSEWVVTYRQSYWTLLTKIVNFVFLRWFVKSRNCLLKATMCCSSFYRVLNPLAGCLPVPENPGKVPDFEKRAQKPGKPRNSTNNPGKFSKWHAIFI